MLDNIL